MIHAKYYVKFFYITALGGVWVSSAEAQLRRYDPNSGQSVAVSGTVGGAPITAQPVTPAVRGAPRETLSTSVAPKAQMPVVQPSQPAPITGPVRVSEIMVFTPLARITPALFKVLREIKEETQLSPTLYVDDHDPKIYFQTLQRMPEAWAKSDGFQPDSGGILAARYRVTQPNTAVVVLSNGTSRIYDVFADQNTLVRFINERKNGK